ncbi:hypothetical protein [Amycolatopsis suaedae]|uniref:Uncharacterized protein n=1 Tax=Amycolatopsis suaedae TaxID=2510978 RepID=A0A4Q7J0C0_9PSEU|nr:hypothetical protein [Amycolatopsis suaedae]RZQ59813.1 hypothetical protein EWH70_32375 [Amycolatopsis suaedae]
MNARELLASQRDVMHVELQDCDSDHPHVREYAARWGRALQAVLDVADRLAGYANSDTSEEAREAFDDSQAEIRRAITTELSKEESTTLWAAARLVQKAIDKLPEDD